MVVEPRPLTVAELASVPPTSNESQTREAPPDQGHRFRLLNLEPRRVRHRISPASLLPYSAGMLDVFTSTERKLRGSGEAQTSRRWLGTGIPSIDTESALRFLARAGGRSHPESIRSGCDNLLRAALVAMLESAESRCDRHSRRRGLFGLDKLTRSRTFTSWLTCATPAGRVDLLREIGSDVHFALFGFEGDALDRELICVEGTSMTDNRPAHRSVSCEIVVSEFGQPDLRGGHEQRPVLSGLASNDCRCSPGRSRGGGRTRKVLMETPGEFGRTIVTPCQGRSGEANQSGGFSIARHV